NKGHPIASKSNRLVMSLLTPSQPAFPGAVILEADIEIALLHFLPEWNDLVEISNRNALEINSLSTALTPKRSFHPRYIPSTSFLFFRPLSPLEGSVSNMTMHSNRRLPGKMEKDP